MRKILQFAEQGFTVMSLLHYAGGPLVVILSGGANEGEGGEVTHDYALVQLLFLLIYLITFLLLIVRWKKVLFILTKDRSIWVLIGIALISVLWSDAPNTTLSRDVALIGTTLFGLYFATRYNPRQQLQLLGWTFGLSIVLSVLFAVALPKYGIMGGIHSGKWRGIYAHKNVLGKTMVLSAVSFLLLAISARKNSWLLWCGLAFSLILIVLSASSSSLINFLTLIAAFCVFQTLRWRYDLMILAVLTIATVGGGLSLWLTTNAGSLLNSMGKDATLTGRGDMWPLILEMIGKRLWLGYGYSGFWRGWDGESAYIWRVTGWTPPNSHNGLLDLWLDLGLLGVTIFSIGFLTNLFRSLAWVRLSRASESFWPVIYITYFVLANLTESSLLTQNSIFWVLYVAMSFSVLMPPEGRTKIAAS